MSDPDETLPEPDVLDLARDIARSYRAPGQAAATPRRRTTRPSRPSRPRQDEPSSLADLLGQVVREQGWDDQLDAQRVFTDWARIVGPEVSQHAVIEGFEGAVVQVRTDSTAWATQIKLLAPRIVAKLNEELGDGSVVRIEVRGPQAPSWKSGSRSIRGARGPRDTYG